MDRRAVVAACLLGLALAWSGAPDGADAAMRKAPYLVYAGVPAEMRVLWQVTSTENCTIQWGPDISYSAGSAQTVEYGLDHQHAYTIAGLAPGALCYYRVTVGGADYPGSFRAAPPEDAIAVKFVAYGDTRSYPVDHDKVAARILARIAADPELQTMVLSVGDLVYNGDLETDWDSQFFNPSYPNIKTVLASFPYQVAIGNHEKTGAGFVKYFPYPFVAGRYWSFDYGPAHFAVVDQYTPYTAGTDQLAWLEADLAGTDKPWRFVYLHEPGWSAGGGHANNTAVQTYIQPLCEAYDVAMLFAGHNHYYARASVNGVEHVTAGGGGAPLHTPDLGYPYVVTGTGAYSHCEIAIDGGSLSLRAVTWTDSLIDSLSISLPGAEVPPTGMTPALGPVSLGPVHPNPSGQDVTIRFALRGAARAGLAIYATDGRKVADLEAGDLAAGPHSASWDGLDATGGRVSPGVYFVRLEACGRALSAKLVVLN
ncbi:MAG: metallophosphoesterase [bacterium]